MKKIILIGAGGHANSVIDVINSTKNFIIEKVIDEKNYNKIINKTKVEKQKNFLIKNSKKKKYSFIFFFYL